MPYHFHFFVEELKLTPDRHTCHKAGSHVGSSNLTGGQKKNEDFFNTEHGHRKYIVCLYDLKGLKRKEDVTAADLPGPRHLEILLIWILGQALGSARILLEGRTMARSNIT